MTHMKEFAFIQTTAHEYWLFTGNLQWSYEQITNKICLFSSTFMPTDSHEKAWLTADKIEKFSDLSWIDSLQLSPIKEHLFLDWSEAPQSSFNHDFDQLQDLISEGKLKKGVPFSYHQSETQMTEEKVHFLLRHLPHLPQGLRAYGIVTEKNLLLGATPEILFELHSPCTLSTMAVAGTQWNDKLEEAKEKKDQDEHQWVVKYLGEQLGELGKLSFSPIQEKRFGKIGHKITEVSLSAQNPLHFLDLIKRLHPTPALGAYPMNEAGKKWLKALHPASLRQRFGAPFAIVFPTGEALALVAIRNLQYGHNKFFVMAGCGVVQESRPENEWEEIQQKIQTVKDQWFTPIRS